MFKNKQKNQNKEDQAGPELRQDLVSGDWVIVAPKRTKRHNKTKVCPFCYIKETQQEDPVLEYKKSDGQWSLLVIPNKFPSLDKYESLERREVGPFSVMNAAGFHEVVITRDHNRHIPNLSVDEVAEIIDAYQERYLDLMNKRFINYISIFHNYGREAGASLEHPHSQLMALTVIDPDIRRSLRGSKEYHQKNKRCVHCTMIEWEIEQNNRIILKNDDFVAYVPFVSRIPLEIRIFPIEHGAYFERIKEKEKFNLAAILKEALQRLHEVLGEDTAYNFFIHTAPCDGLDYGHYHWHIEILPVIKTAIQAGFEKGARIEIVPITPEDSAKKLREAQI